MCTRHANPFRLFKQAQTQSQVPPSAQSPQATPSPASPSYPYGPFPQTERRDLEHGARPVPAVHRSLPNQCMDGHQYNRSTQGPTSQTFPYYDHRAVHEGEKDESGNIVDCLYDIRSSEQNMGISRGHPIAFDTDDCISVTSYSSPPFNNSLTPWHTRGMLEPRESGLHSCRGFPHRYIFQRRASYGHFSSNFCCSPRMNQYRAHISNGSHRPFVIRVQDDYNGCSLQQHHRYRTQPSPQLPHIRLGGQRRRQSQPYNERRRCRDYDKPYHHNLARRYVSPLSLVPNPPMIRRPSEPHGL